MPATPKPLAAKLGIKAGQLTVLLKADRAVVQLLKRQAPPGVRWAARLSKGRADMIVVWFRARDNLRREFRRFLEHIQPDGAVWGVVAKATVNDADSPSWETMVKAALRSGVWVDNKICSVSERDYATRFVIRKEKRGRLTPSR